jgi:hypothetical protein
VAAREKVKPTKGAAREPAAVPHKSQGASVNVWVQIFISILAGALVQALIGFVFIGIMKQQLTDLVGWMKALAADVKELLRSQKDLEGRVSHIEGRLGIERARES